MAINYQYQGPKITNRNLLFYLDPNNINSYNYINGNNKIYDVSKNNYTGSFTGSITYTNNNNEGNFSFHGTPSSIGLSNQLNNFLTITSSFSIQTLCNFNSFDSFSGFNYGPVLFGNNYDSVINNGVQLRINTSGQILIILASYNAGVQYFLATSDTSLSLNTWYLITVTYNGSGNESGLKIYINGTQDTNTINFSGVVTDIYSTGSYYIGNTPEGGQFSGSISYFQTYGNELKPVEIYNNYLAVKDKFAF